ncbi:MAG TPA: hypothetical protein VF331_14690 [Polyangiales bacterium]
MRNIVWGVKGLLAVTVIGRLPPRDDEWDEYVKHVQHVVSRPEVKRLVYSLGGWPTALQRKQLMELVGDNKKPVAMIACNAEVRSRTMSMRWFNPSWQSFSVEELEDALRYLELSPTQQASAKDLIETLLVELSDQQAHVHR